MEIHPNVAELYPRKVTELSNLFTDEATRGQAMDNIRSLIDRIEIHHGEKRRSPDVILVGALANILEYACTETSTAGSMGDGDRFLVVAGARNQRCLQLVSARISHTIADSID